MANSDDDMKALVPINYQHSTDPPLPPTLPKDETLTLVLEKATTLRVLLPNNTTVSVSMALNEQTDIKDIIHAAFLKHKEPSSGIPNEREIDWSNSWLEIVTGEVLQKFHFEDLKTQLFATIVFQDGRPNAVHSHEHMWDLTPQPQMLERLPQGYSLHTALADEVDNALQAVWENAGNKRYISVDLSPDCISIFDSGPGMDASVQNSIEFWGTLGRTKHREKNREGIGGLPPFLKPYLGKYGAGGVAAALHLGRCVKVSSKTMASKRVVTLAIDLQGLEGRSDTQGNLWKTKGSFREMTGEEREKAPHGSFTKVEITRLKDQYCISNESDGRNYWKVAQLKRQLKDIYYLYIQSDDGISSKMTCPVSFVVNNQDLLEVTDSEISITYMHTSNGQPFVCDMEFRRPVDAVGSGREIDMETAHLRIKCDYFPNLRGREMLQEVLDRLIELDKDYPCNFETMPRVGVRWLGRLLPDAKWPILPFMDVAHNKQEEVRRMWSRRVKAFVETDAGFHPTQSKTELEKDHPFTVALRKLGGPRDRMEGVKVRIRYMDKLLPVEELPKVYMTWLQNMHEEFDHEVVFLDPPIFIFHQQSLRELKVTNQVALIHKKINYNERFVWDITDEVPIRLKFSRGCTGMKGTLYATLEYFYCGGTEDEKGEVHMVCRPIEIADEDGSKLEQSGEQCIFHVNKSLCFPFTTLLSDKCNKVDENEWNNQLKRYGETSPAFVEILNQEDSEHFGLKQALPPTATFLEAGYTLPEDLFVVVRPRKGAGPSFRKGRIIPEPMKVLFSVTFKSELADMESRSSRTKDETDQSQELLHETVSQSIIHSSGVKGLYCFHTKGTSFSILTRKGEYTFQFELISDDYRHVQPAISVLKVKAAEGKPRWTFCTHKGLCSERHHLSVRLNEQVKQALFIQKIDEYGNTRSIDHQKLENLTLITVGRKGEWLDMSTTRSISDPEITVKDRGTTILLTDMLFAKGNLTRIQPSREAYLQLYLDGEKVAEMLCSVLPGDIASVELISGTTFEMRCFNPHEIIQQVTFQARDKFGNHAARGQRMIMVLEGVNFVNAGDTLWEVDENGQLHLGGLLEVTAPFNEKGFIRITSESHVDLIELQVNVVNRNLQICGKWLRKAYCGRQLEGLLVEIVDEEGKRDTAVDAHGMIPFRLAVTWVPNADFFFTEGVCSLPTIHLPSTPGVWAGTAFLSNNVRITLRLEVEVEMAVATMLASSSHETVVAKSGEPFYLRFRTLDEKMQPGILTDELINGLEISIYTPQNLEGVHRLRAFEESANIAIQSLRGDAGTYEASVTLLRQMGIYFLKLSHLGSNMEGVVSWKVLVEHGKLSEMVPFLRSKDGKHGHNTSKICSLEVSVGDLFPSLEIQLLDSEQNLCTRYHSGFLNLCCENYPEWKVLTADIGGGKAVFEQFVVKFGPGSYELYLETVSVTETASEFEVFSIRPISLQVIPGNYPSQLRFEVETAPEIRLSDEVPQFLPEVMVLVDSADGRRLKNQVNIVAKILATGSYVAESREPEIVCCNIYDVPSFSNYDTDDATVEQRKRHCGSLKYICNELPVPRRPGKYLLLIYLDEPLYHVDPISRPFLVKHGPPHQIVLLHQKTIGEELEQLDVKVIDIHGNVCSESFGKLGLSFNFDRPTLSSRDSEGISEPCHLLSRSTGNLIAGVCKLDKFEISLGIEGMYLMKVFYEVHSELVISSENLEVLITSGNIHQSSLERVRKIQSLTQELKAKAEETSQIHEELRGLRDRIRRLDMKIDILSEDVKHLKEQEETLKPTHLIDKEDLKREELLDNTVQTREDVQRAIKNLHWPQSSPLDMCERRRRCRENQARANIILDTLVTLAGVEDNRLNSILSVYLGESNLLLVVCETREELKELSEFNKWNGRCEVMCLEELGFYGITVDTDHRQQLLQFPEPSWNNGGRPQGFLGFAVNMIHLRPNQMHLRGSVFYKVLGEAQVYDTEENMKIGLENLRGPHRAMSLDGAIVKDPYRHQVGQCGPAISFPSVNFAERRYCSLVPPMCDVFERERRWLDLSTQILEKTEEIVRCEIRRSDITMQLTELKSNIIIRTEDERDLEETVKDLGKEVETIKPMTELIDLSLSSAEYKMRVLLARAPLSYP